MTEPTYITYIKINISFDKKQIDRKTLTATEAFRRSL